MEKKSLPLPDLILIIPQVFADHRGLFKEAYQQERYERLGISVNFVQDNLSFSHYNVLRGLHMQTPTHQAKLVSVIQGEIFDVAVDLRPDSPTFKNWYGLYLNSENHNQLFIPKGFAHGFCVTSPSGAWVHYKTSSFYTPQEEKTIRFDDPDLNISWPSQSPILSPKDLSGIFIKDLFS